MTKPRLSILGVMDHAMTSPRLAGVNQVRRKRLPPIVQLRFPDAIGHGIRVENFGLEEAATLRISALDRKPASPNATLGARTRNTSAGRGLGPADQISCPARPCVLTHGSEERFVAPNKPQISFEILAKLYYPPGDVPPSSAAPSTRGSRHWNVDRDGQKVETLEHHLWLKKSPTTSIDAVSLAMVSDG